MATEIGLHAPRIVFNWASFKECAERIRRIAPHGFRHPRLLNLFEDIKKGAHIACLAIEDAMNNRSFVGYIIYKWSDKWIYIYDIAILPELYEIGTMKQIIKKLIQRTKDRRRECIIIDVRERNATLQMVLKNCKFKAVSVLADFFGNEDAYRMVYIPEGSNFPFESLCEEDFQLEI